MDFFGIGEHHTQYFPMPAGDVVLAAIAARTERIHLGSAVTVLSSDDPVRGKTRAPLLNQDVVPHTAFGPFPARIGVGGNPQPVIRAARPACV